MKRKLLSLLLTLVLVLSLLPHTAWAEIKSGTMVINNIKYSYDTDTKTLTLSGNYSLHGDGFSSPLSAYAKLPMSEIKTVVMKSGITGIGSIAFQDCRSLTSISIPNTVTYIGEGAFRRCASLTSITIPAGVTTIEYNAFDDCNALTSVTFQGPITQIGRSAFAGLDSLRTVTFPSRVGSSASIEESAFSECSSLESIVIPEGVDSIGNDAFYKCTALRSVTFPSSLQYLDGAFTFCRALESITFTGDAPAFKHGPFLDVTATVYYPAGNPTWTADVMQNYGGNLTWVAVCTGSHSLGEWTTVDENKHQRSCIYCDYEETAEHTWDEGSVTTAPTCQTTGEALFTCTGCGATRNETLPIGDHPYNEWTTVDDQTHTHTCTVCETVETLPHSWDEGTTVKAANCIADGEMKYTCTGCGLTRSEVVPMNGIHTYDHDCDKDCNICGATRTTSHKFSSDWSSSKSGHWHKCVNCGEKKDLADHVPGPEATEETPQVCTVCDYLLRPTLQHEHAFAATLTGDETGHWYACATCTEQKDFTAHGFTNDCDTQCDACGFTRLTQHVWSEAWSHDEAGHFYTCTVCGEKKPDSRSEHDFRRGVCKICTAADPNYEPAPVGLIAAAAAVVCGGAAAAVAVSKKKKKTAA